MTLTTKQQVFIDTYLQGFNATDAAKAAGYAWPTREGWRLLHTSKNAAVREAISQRLSANAMTADEVLSRLAAQARASIGDFLTVADDGSWEIDLAKARDAEKLGLIKTLWVDRNGRVRLELHDQQHALEVLAKYHGLFSDAANVSVGVALGPQIILDNGPATDSV